MKRATALWLALATFCAHGIGVNVMQLDKQFGPPHPSETPLSIMWTAGAVLILVALLWYAYRHPDQP